LGTHFGRLGFWNCFWSARIGQSDSDPNTILCGHGRVADSRGNVSHGDGVYKSTDGGKTWKHIGLEDTRQISPRARSSEEPDIVYVARAGPRVGAERGPRCVSINGRR
jgi:hypothetical protein